METRKLKLEKGQVRVDFLSDVEKAKIKKIFKKEVKIYSSPTGVFFQPTGHRSAESIALDVADVLKMPLLAPEGTSFAHCFAEQRWPSVPALAR